MWTKFVLFDRFSVRELAKKCEPKNTKNFDFQTILDARISIGSGRSIIYWQKNYLDLFTGKLYMPEFKKILTDFWQLLNIYNIKYCSFETVCLNVEMHKLYLFCCSPYMPNTIVWWPTCWSHSKQNRFLFAKWLANSW